jgi:Tfp pilus assembly protein PilO
MSAPILCLIFLVFGVVVAWWFRSSTAKGQIEGVKAQNDGLREQIHTWEQRLTLTREQEQAATKKASETKEAMMTLSKQIANKAPPDEIAITVRSVGIKMEELVSVQQRLSETIQTSLPSGVIMSGYHEKIFSMPPLVGG